MWSSTRGASWVISWVSVVQLPEASQVKNAAAKVKARRWVGFYSLHQLVKECVGFINSTELATCLVPTETWISTLVGTLLVIFWKRKAYSPRASGHISGPFVHEKQNRLRAGQVQSLLPWSLPPGQDTASILPNLECVERGPPAYITAPNYGGFITIGNNSSTE